MPLSNIDVSLIQEFFTMDILQNLNTRPEAINTGDNVAPHLVIITQPCEKFRYRYYSEPGSHGVINGRSTDGKAQKKTFPTVKLVDPGGYLKEPVIIKVRLFTADDSPRPHILHCRNKNNYEKNQDGAFYKELSNDKTAQFENLGIFILKRDEIIPELQQRKMQELHVTELNNQQEKRILEELKSYNQNETKLCFEVVHKDSLTSVGCPPILSDTIYNSKATATSDLKICRLSLFKGSSLGDEDMIILCDKIKKDDVDIRFFNDNWERIAHFHQKDVHHQVAIPFKTPKYDGLSTKPEVSVFIQLIRKSDSKGGDPVQFVYKIDNFNSKKRKLDNDPVSNGISSEDFAYLNGFSLDSILRLEQDDSFDLSMDISDNSSYGSDVVYKDAINASGSLLNENTDVEEISDQLSNFALENFPVEETNRVKKFLKCFSKSVHNLLKDKEILYYTPSSLTVQDCEGNSILHLAIIAKQSLKFVETVLKLIKEDIVNHKNEDLKTPLHLATQHGNAELLKILLKNGGDPSHTDKQGNSSLHIAVMNGFSRCLETILSFICTNLETFSSTVDAENDEGLTPLHLAILMNSADCLKILLENNADVNGIEKKGGKSPLHLAVQEKSPFLEIILSQANVDIWSRDYSGLTALELACIENNLSYENFADDIKCNKTQQLLFLNEILKIKSLETSLEQSKLETRDLELQKAVECILNKSSNWEKLGPLIDFPQEKLKNLKELEENPAGCLIEKIMEEKNLDLKEILKRAELSYIVRSIPGW